MCLSVANVQWGHDYEGLELWMHAVRMVFRRGEIFAYMKVHEGAYESVSR